MALLPVLVVACLVVLSSVIAALIKKPAFKRKSFRVVEKYFANPPVKALLRVGFPMPVALIETTGRKTGKLRSTPVMASRIGDDFWIIAEHGHHAAYVRNLKANPRVRLKKGKQWIEGTAHVLDDDPYARSEWIAKESGRSPRMEVLGTKVMSVDPVTVRIDVSGDRSSPGPGATSRHDTTESGASKADESKAEAISPTPPRRDSAQARSPEPRNGEQRPSARRRPLRVRTPSGTS